MDKFYPTEKVEGDRITLGEPVPVEAEPEVPAQSWTLPAIVVGVATAVVTWGVYALFEWLERRGAGTGN